MSLSSFKSPFLERGHGFSAGGAHPRRRCERAEEWGARPGRQAESPRLLDRAPFHGGLSSLPGETWSRVPGPMSPGKAAPPDRSWHGLTGRMPPPGREERR